MKNAVKNHDNQRAISYVLDEEAIIEFQNLYKKEYGTLLTKQEAIEYGSGLIGFVKAVYGYKLPKSVDLPKNEADN